MFSVCTVLYGDHPDLARRLLDGLASSLPPQPTTFSVRIGLNAVGEQTRALVWDFCGNKMLAVNCYVYEPPENVGKYPLMRRMFYDQSRPLESHVMWFDDDSYLDGRVDEKWWKAVTKVAQANDIAGVIHKIRQRGNQWQGIRQQSWFGGKPVDRQHFFRFATGGWWTARSGFLTRWNYPFPALHHNGGDSILGELARQQGATLAGIKQHAQCHCPSCLKGGRGSKLGVVHVNDAQRRGIGVRRRDEVYVWERFPAVDDLSHHQFECRVYSFETSHAELRRQVD